MQKLRNKLDILVSNSNVSAISNDMNAEAVVGVLSRKSFSSPIDGVQTVS